MASSGDSGELRRYVSELRSVSDDSESAAVTGNATADALLYAKAPLLEEQGLRLEKTNRNVFHSSSS